jgi:hypothetical protein
MSDAVKPPVSTARKVIAGILDFLTVFFIGGYIIGMLSGGNTDQGFQLNGMPAIILLAVIIAYFVIGHRYAGGTIWQRLLKAR